MRNILARANREVLQQFAWSRVLLAFDFDGTLAPIVSRPERAIMRQTTTRLLAKLVKRYPCVVISGRAQRDVMERLQGIAVHGIVGNHGLEPWHGTDRPVDGAVSGPVDEPVEEVAHWRPLLEENLGGLRGVQIEYKVYSVAVHYRLSREKKAVRNAIMKTALALGEVRLIGGKQVVNILPKGAPHKGIALERERARLACDTAIYVGDDETDEDVFALDQPGQLLSISVGRRRTSGAAYFIASQREIEELLRTLVVLRQSASIARPPSGGP